jgi:hypothetical protein
MPRPSALPAQDKIRIVLSILAGEVTVAEAALRAKVSETTIGNWKRQFVEARQCCGRVGCRYWTQRGRACPGLPSPEPQNLPAT